MKAQSGGAATLKPPATPRVDPDLVTGVNGYQFHPLTKSFPRLIGKDLDELVEEIKLRREPRPILKRGEVILDDPNYFTACTRAGVELKFQEWDGMGSLAVAIARAIIPTIHLSDSQRATVAADLTDQLAAETLPARQAGLLREKPKRREEEKNGADNNLQKPRFQQTAPLVHKCTNGELQNIASQNGAVDRGDNRAAAVAAKLCHIGVRNVFKAIKLRKDNPGLFERVRAGLLNLSQATLESDRLARARLLTPAFPRRAVGQADDELLVGDCVEHMAKMPPKDKEQGGWVDLVFADPPYNLGLPYDSDPTRDQLPSDKYLAFSELWMRHCARLLSPRGSMFVMINDRWQGYFDVLLRKIGLHHRRTIIWHDNFPNHTDANFQPAARFILYFTKSNKPGEFTWNADPIRIPSRRDEIGDSRRVHAKGIVPHDVWDDINRVAGNAKDRVPWPDAPPQVPAPILRRILLAASNPGDRVLDPFAGNCTTWKECKALGRKFTGIERSAKYAKQGRQWAEGK